MRIFDDSRSRRYTCKTGRLPLMVSPIVMISVLFTVSSAAAAGAKPMSAKTLPLLLS